MMLADNLNIEIRNDVTRQPVLTTNGPKRKRKFSTLPAVFVRAYQHIFFFFFFPHSTFLFLFCVYLLLTLTLRTLPSSQQ